MNKLRQNRLQMEHFIEALNKGRRGLYISTEVVAMPAKVYWAITKALQKKRTPSYIVIDEAEELFMTPTVPDE